MTATTTIVSSVFDNGIYGPMILLAGGYALFIVTTIVCIMIASLYCSSSSFDEDNHHKNNNNACKAIILPVSSCKAIIPVSSCKAIIPVSSCKAIIPVSSCKAMALEVSETALEESNDDSSSNTSTNTSSDDSDDVHSVSSESIDLPPTEFEFNGDHHVSSESIDLPPTEIESVFTRHQQQHQHQDDDDSQRHYCHDGFGEYSDYSHSGWSYEPKCYCDGASDYDNFPSKFDQDVAAENPWEFLEEDDVKRTYDDPISEIALNIPNKRRKIATVHRAKTTANTTAGQWVSLGNNSWEVAPKEPTGFIGPVYDPDFDEDL